MLNVDNNIFLLYHKLLFAQFGSRPEFASVNNMTAFFSMRVALKFFKIPKNSVAAITFSKQLVVFLVVLCYVKYVAVTETEEDIENILLNTLSGLTAHATSNYIYMVNPKSKVNQSHTYAVYMPALFRQLLLGLLFIGMLVYMITENYSTVFFQLLLFSFCLAALEIMTHILLTLFPQRGHWEKNS